MVLGRAKETHIYCKVSVYTKMKKLCLFIFLGLDVEWDSCLMQKRFYIWTIV